LWIEPEVHSIRNDLPGNVRQRVKRIFDDLTGNPYPSNSKALNVAGLEIHPNVEIRRVRLEQWRVLYAVNEQEHWVWVLGIYRRPPYQYEDLQKIISKMDSE